MAPTRKRRVFRKLSHDKIFKTLFQLHLQDFVELLERDMAPLLDFAAVEYPSGEAFAELKKAGHLNPDLVVRIRRRDAGPPMLLHAEIESRFRGGMAPRMWKYFTHLSAQHPDAVVVPVVIYLEGGPPGLREQATTSEVGNFVPVVFRHLSLGLAGCLAEDWLEKPQVLAAALAACMRSKIWDPVEHKLQCLRRVMNETNPERRHLLARVVEIYLRLTDDENERYQQAFALESRTMMSLPLTLAETIEALEQKEAHGIAMGAIRAKREAILRIIELRFGDVPVTLRRKLAKISELDRLNGIFDRAVQALSINEMKTVLG